MSVPKVFGDQDVTIAIGPTGVVRIWAGQMLIGMLDKLEMKVVGDTQQVEVTFPTFGPDSSGPDGDPQAVDQYRSKLADYPQVTVMPPMVVT